MRQKPAMMMKVVDLKNAGILFVKKGVMMRMEMRLRKLIVKTSL